MKEKIYALNICLIPSKALYDTCLKLNKLDTNSKYNENSRAFIPHATLAIKYVSAEKFKKIQEAIDVLNISKLSVKVLEYYAKQTSATDCWTGIYTEKTPELKALQETICGITKQFENDKRDHSSYAIDNFFEKNQLPLWDEAHFKDKPDLHITLWKTDIQDHIDQISLPAETIFDTLVIWHMWNYGSVREILYSKKLW